APRALIRAREVGPLARRPVGGLATARRWPGWGAVGNRRSTGRRQWRSRYCLGTLRFRRFDVDAGDEDLGKRDKATFGILRQVRFEELAVAAVLDRVPERDLGGDLVAGVGDRRGRQRLRHWLLGRGEEHRPVGDRPVG